MAYSEELATRIRDAVGGRDGVTERRMFGGIVWMVNGNIGCGTLGEDLMVRLSSEDAELALAEPGVGPMRFGERTMRAFLAVSAATIADDAELTRWAEAGANFASTLPPK